MGLSFLVELIFEQAHYLSPILTKKIEAKYLLLRKSGQLGILNKNGKRRHLRQNKGKN